MIEVALLIALAAFWLVVNYKTNEIWLKLLSLVLLVAHATLASVLVVRMILS